VEDLAVPSGREDRFVAVVVTDDQERIVCAPADLDDLTVTLGSADGASVDADAIAYFSMHRRTPPRSG
jgi:hypothetical protein